MLARLLAFLRQPYPVPDGADAQFRRALWIGLFVGGFLLLFQPFGLKEWQDPLKSLKIAGFGLVSAVVTFGWYAGTGALAPAWFRENRWTVARAALFLNLNIALIAGGNLLYLSWAADTPLHQLQPGWMLAVTFLIGLFPAAGVTAATYIRQLRQHQAGAALINQPIVGAATEPLPAALVDAPLITTLTFTPDNGKDSLTIPAAAVLYLEAADNYCTVVHGVPGAGPTRTLLRASLSRLAGQAAEQRGQQLARVHRSYLVNLSRVARVSGNAQGYRLHLLADVEPVPVGRTYAEAVLAALRRTSDGPHRAATTL
ncbi:MAG: response regulator transcription factor [Hymenobacteraceae bacterium]|nr:response regulator transcription factor [Hymenobacteraceae bacterium]